MPPSVKVIGVFIGSLELVVGPKRRPGKRVKKIAYDATGNETETTIFVYDAAGKQIVEYSTVVADAEGVSFP